MAPAPGQPAIGLAYGPHSASDTLLILTGPGSSASELSSHISRAGQLYFWLMYVATTIADYCEVQTTRTPSEEYDLKAN